jgi:ABC-type antimicrobial peptide transport system permease subunit
LTLLRAVGASVGQLVSALLVQVVLVVVGGLAVGVALLALASLTSSPEFPFRVEPGAVARSAAIVLLLAFVASIVAVRRVGRVDPAAAVNPPGLGGLA